MTTDNHDSREHQILAACRAGDWSEYGVLVKRYRRLVWAAVDAVVADETAAADLVQEAFIRAYEKLHTFRGRSRFSSWLYRVARNQALSHVRRLRRRPPPASLDDGAAGERDLHEKTAGDGGPDQDYEHLARARAVERMLKSLPASYRELVNLHYLGEFSYQDIADTLGMPINTVKTKLRRARLRLQEQARRLGWQ